MPEFTVKYSREVTVRDEYEETIEAATLEEAQAKAEELASSYNMSCPDGVEEGAVTDTTDWGVDEIEPAEASAETAEA